jgi:hypothetical protein
VAEPKTRVNDAPVADFLDAIPEAQLRQDAWQIVEMMRRVTKARPRMWGSGIVGFGEAHAVYANGTERDWPLIAFAPRKQQLTLYIMDGFEAYEPLLSALGRYKRGKTCLHIRRLADVRVPTLDRLVRASVRRRRRISARAQGRRSGM